MNGRQFFEDYHKGKVADPSNFIVMPKSDFIKEHKKLIGILDRKNPKELNAERKEQASEMARYVKKGESSR
jgi:hypothetical protein